MSGACPPHSSSTEAKGTMKKERTRPAVPGRVCSHGVERAGPGWAGHHSEASDCRGDKVPEGLIFIGCASFLERVPLAGLVTTGQSGSLY